ncbi:MAG: pyruvyl transferase [Dokdonia sp.]|jgi:pyruvyltransferase
MGVKTYYWNTRKVSAIRFLIDKYRHPEKKVFRYGNAGDIFNIDLIKYLYKDNPVLTTTADNRILIVGSVLRVLEEGDIVNGIGWKGDDLSIKEKEIAGAKVFGVRGPLTRSIFEKYGADLTDLKFELDPGLLIKQVYNLDLKKSSEDQVIFIPHYRDLWVYKDQYPDGIKVINIDNKPQTIAKEILKSKVVYASSLHGIIFAHALKKPCVFVAPQSEEPIFKYRDYYLSVGFDMPEPLKDIHAINFLTDIATLPERDFTMDDFYFPDYEYLKKSNIIK